MIVKEKYHDIGKKSVNGIRIKNHPFTIVSKKPEPFYQDKFITLYHGDCNKIIPLLDAPDYVFYDPPYQEWCNVKKIEGVERYLAFTNFQNRYYTEEVLGRASQMITWFHADGGSWVAHDQARRVTTEVYLYGNTNDARVGDYVEDRTPIPKGDSSIGVWRKKKRIYIPSERRYLTTLISSPKNMQKKLAKLGKPLKLVYQLLEFCTKKEDMIYDPYSGAGTVLLAAKMLGRRAVGIEMKKDLCEEIKNRLTLMNESVNLKESKCKCRFGCKCK